jgi:hypothetical protein
MTELGSSWTQPANWWAHDRSPGKIFCRVEGTRVIIDRADPIIWIGAETVSWAALGNSAPRITVTPPANWSEGNYWIDSVIRFHGDNRDVLYRLTSWAGGLTAWGPDNNGRYDLGYYLAEWPD